MKKILTFFLILKYQPSSSLVPKSLSKTLFTKETITILFSVETKRNFFKQVTPII